MDNLMTEWASAATQEGHRLGLHAVMEELAQGKPFAVAVATDAIARLQQLDVAAFDPDAQPLSHAALLATWLPPWWPISYVGQTKLSLE
jgi:hypothetical protein